MPCLRVKQRDKHTRKLCDSLPSVLPWVTAMSLLRAESHQEADGTMTKGKDIIGERLTGLFRSRASAGKGKVFIMAKVIERFKVLYTAGPGLERGMEIRLEQVRSM